MVSAASLFPALPMCVCEARVGYTDELEPHYESVRCFLRSLCRETDLARDLTQETYLRAYTHLARHARAIEHPRSWLFTIARRTFIDHVRYTVARSAVRVESFEVVDDAESVCAAEAVATEEERERLGRAIEALSPLNKALLVGFHVAGEDIGCLARRHGLSRSAARVRVFRARRQLRRRLS